VLVGVGADGVGDGVGVGVVDGPVLGVTVLLGVVGLVDGCGRLLGASE
jgi:hypothetical protein